MQTRDGYLWLATLDGLVRYDGVRFTVFNRNNSEGIKSNRLTQMVVDGRGNLWIGTESGSVTRHHDGHFQTYKIAADAKDKTIWKMVLNRAGVFSVFSESGIVSWDGEKFAPYSPIAGETADSVVLWGKSGAFWYADGQTIRRFKDNLVTDFRLPGTYEDAFIMNLIEDSRGRLWVGTLRAGLLVLENGKLTAFTVKDGLPSGQVSPRIEDRDGNLWAVTNQGAVIIAADGKISHLTTRQGLSDNNLSAFYALSSVYEDREGNIWIGSLYRGLNRLTHQSVTFYSKKDGLAADVVNPIYQTRGGDILIGGKNLTRYAAGRFSAVGGRGNFSGGEVTAIEQDRQGRLWFGFWGGVYYSENGKFTDFTDKIGQPVNPTDIHEDSGGSLWFATNAGLFRYQNGAVTRYTTNDGLFNEGVFQILEDEHGWFWISCNRGIYRVAKQQLNDFADGKISRIESIAYNKADGLLETECNGGQQPAGIRARDGKLWFPTQRGVAVIDPDSVKTNPYPPPVLIESAKVDSEEAALGERLEIAPGKNNLEIAYTGLSFIKPEFVKFRYKLEGLDSDWVEAGDRRTAYYSYLPPGDYTFHVIAANSDGVWNMEGARLRVRVVPPFYRTWSFGILSLALVGGAAFLFYRGRVARLERARAAQEEFSRKLLASQEQERQRIAAELHDSIGQSLLIIKNGAFLALSDLDEPETVREQLEELSESATGAIEECREISYNLRPYQINRFGLTKTLEAIFRRISEVTEIKTTVDVDSIDGVFSAEAETNIYRVVQESANNIIKHSQATEAELIIKRRDNEVGILIEDNGRGFDRSAADARNGNKRGGSGLGSGPKSGRSAADARGSTPISRTNTSASIRVHPRLTLRSGLSPLSHYLGLIGMTERVRLLGGVYEIDSAQGKGTSIKIKLQSTAGGTGQSIRGSGWFKAHHTVLGRDNSSARYRRRY